MVMSENYSSDNVSDIRLIDNGCYDNDDKLDKNT